MLVITDSNEDTIIELTAEKCEVSLEQSGSRRIELIVSETKSLRRFRMNKQIRGARLRMSLESAGPTDSAIFTRRESSDDESHISTASSPECDLSVRRDGDHGYTVVMTNCGEGPTNQCSDWEIKISIATQSGQRVAMAEIPAR